MYIERWRRRQRNKILFSALLAILGVGALGTSTFAWFMMVRNQTLTYSGVNVQTSIDLSIDYKIYGYDEDNRAGKELDLVGESPTDKFLEEYDTFILERNENNNRIIAVDVTFVKEIETPKTIVSRVVATSAFDDGNGHVAEYISNIIYFRTLLISIDGVSVDASTLYTDAVNASDENAIYTTGKALFDSNIVDPTCFVTSTGTPENLSSFNKVDGNILEFRSPSIPAGSTSARVLIEYNYSEPLISAYESLGLFSGAKNWGSTDILQGNNVVTFGKDISYLRMDLEEAS